MLSSNQFSPDAKPETTSVDGDVLHNGAVFATVQSAGTGTTASDALTASTVANSFASLRYTIQRGFILFDTSTLPNLNKIVTATIILVGTGTKTDDNADSIHIVSSTPASNIELVVGDYDQVGSTSFASMAISAWNTAGNNTFTLNAAGRAAVTTTGISKFGIRLGRDISATAPTGTNRIEFVTADGGVLGNPPILQITHGRVKDPIMTNGIIPFNRK